MVAVRFKTVVRYPVPPVTVTVTTLLLLGRRSVHMSFDTPIGSQSALVNFLTRELLVISFYPWLDGQWPLIERPPRLTLWL